MSAGTPIAFQIIYIETPLKRRMPLPRIYYRSLALINSIDSIEIVFKIEKLNKIKWNFTIIKKRNYIHCTVHIF